MESSKARWLARGNSEETPLNKWFKLPGGSRSLWACLCVPIYLHFPPNKQFSCFRTSISLLKFIFCKVIQARSLSLTTGQCKLGFSVLTTTTWLQSLARNQNPASSHCSQGHLRSILLLFSHIKLGKNLLKSFICSVLETRLWFMYKF